MADEPIESPESPEEGIAVKVQEDKYKPSLTDEEVTKLEQIPEDEITRYAKDAQRRIKSLREVGRELRLRSEQSQRDAAAAINLTEQLYRENQELKKSVTRNEAAVIDQAMHRATAELEHAKAHYRSALTAQDVEGITAANEEMARSVAELDRLRLLKPQAAAKDKEEAAPTAAAPAPSGAAAPRPNSPATNAWLAKHPWFNAPGEEEPTHFLVGVHNRMERQGITEQNNPEVYWSTINAQLKKRFPEKLPEAEPAPKTTAARPANMTGGVRANGPAAQGGRQRVVTLSESQVKLARVLGLTNEQYAAQLVKEEEEAAGRTVVQ